MTTTPHLDTPQARSTLHWFLSRVLLSGLVLLSWLGAGCEMGRFPVCKTNDDCKSQEKARICYNLKCVECRYDTDCKAGFTCNSLNECESIGSTANAGDGGIRAWGPGNWDECAKQCDNPDCIKACDQQFQK